MHGIFSTRGGSDLPYDKAASATDLSDGSEWNSDSFLDNHINLKLSLSLDWFSAFTSPRTGSYSVGAVALRVDNLPAGVRNRPENHHVVFLLPGPRQTSDSGLDSAMQPLIAELKALHKGVPVQTHSSALQQTLRAKVWMAIGDTPGRAKIAGFASHSQHSEFCGYCHADKASWYDEFAAKKALRLRDPVVHKATARQSIDLNPTRRRALLKSDGATWSPLYDLPYWYSVSHVPLDAMHALHLGVCKRFYHYIVVEGGLLVPTGAKPNHSWPTIEAVLQTAAYPRGVTHIRTDFGLPKSGVPSADSWSVFARFLMSFVLCSFWHDDLKKDASMTYTSELTSMRTAQGAFRTSVKVKHLLDASLHLTKITQICQRKSVSENDLRELDDAIRAHIELLAKHIDHRVLVPNHHLLLHLTEHVRRFGPPRGFWFYDAERLNGLLKDSHHNGHPQGELELSMQNNLLGRRLLNSALRDLDDSPSSERFRRMLGEDAMDAFDECYEPGPLTTFALKRGLVKHLSQPSLDALVQHINRIRDADDPMAIDASTQTRSGLTGISARVHFFEEVIIHGTRVTSASSSAKMARGGDQVIVSVGRSVQVGVLISAFEHTYIHGRSGAEVKAVYAKVRVMESVPWPDGQALSTSEAAKYGFFLADLCKAPRIVVPLECLVDTYISVTAKFITQNDQAIFAARSHP